MKAIRKKIHIALFIALILLSSCTTAVRNGREGLVGIAWREDADSEFYTNIARTLEDLGIPYRMVDQAIAYSIPYKDGRVDPSCVDENGILIEEYAEIVKDEAYRNSNAGDALDAYDYRAVIFTGGEDISPTLLKDPKPWHGIEKEKDYNATRDVSDYLLLSYCLDNDIPAIGFCRGSQMLGVVSGAGIIQDLPVYFEENGIEYSNEHRNEKESDDDYRDYAPHDVILSEGTIAREIYGKDVLEGVPSWHHQVLTGLEGTELKLAGYTEVNGIRTAEIVERRDKDYAIGFQFHPEAAYIKHIDEKENSSLFMDKETASLVFMEIGRMLQR